MTRKRTVRAALSLVLTAVLIAGLAAVAANANVDASVTFDASARNFIFKNVNPEQDALPYTDADGHQYPDLFPDLKGLMPGDTVTENITVKAANMSGGSAVIRLRVQDDHTDINVDDVTESEEAAYQKLLETATLTVKDGDTVLGNDSLAAGVSLGIFRDGDSKDLTVTLELPMEAGNELQGLTAGVAWIFTATYIEPTPDPTPDPDPDPTPDPDPEPPVLTKDHYAYIIGYPDGTVQPMGDITRAEVATIFFRLLTNESRNQYWSRSNRFTDVNEGDWYNNAISTLTNAKILDGYPDGTFQPNGKITRAEFTKIAASFFEKTGATENPFTDVSEEDWFYSYVLNGYDSGIISGYQEDDGTLTFRPNNYITRAEAMAIVNRTIGRAPDKEHFLPDMKTWVDNPESEWYYEDVQEATNSHDYNMMNEESVEDRYEIWTKMLETRDWAALELQWAIENNQGGEVVSSAVSAVFK